MRSTFIWKENLGEPTQGFLLLFVHFCFLNPLASGFNTVVPASFYNKNTVESKT